MTPHSFVKNIVAYADPLSVRHGDTLNVFVSCDVPGDYHACLVRLVSGDDRPRGTGYREVAIDASFAGSYAGARQPLTPGSYAVLPDLPVSAALTFACYFYPMLLEPDERTLAHGGAFQIRVGSAGIGVVIGDIRIDVPAAANAPLASARRRAGCRVGRTDRCATRRKCGTASRLASQPLGSTTRATQPRQLGTCP